MVVTLLQGSDTITITFDETITSKKVVVKHDKSPRKSDIDQYDTLELALKSWQAILPHLTQRELVDSWKVNPTVSDSDIAALHARLDLEGIPAAEPGPIVTAEPPEA